MKQAAAALAALLLLTGCGSATGRPAADASATGALPRPLNVQDPADIPSAGPAPNCVPRASLRPRGALPAPGRPPAGSPMEKIVQRGRLVVGIDQNAYLFGFRDPNTGQLVGFEIEIAKEVARALFGNPETIQFRAITTADRIPVIQRGEVDMVVRTMTMTCERKGFEDLAGKKVCATRGSTSIRLIAAQASKPVPVTTDSTLDCLVLLQQGQVDAVSTIDVLLAGLAAQDPGTEITGPPLSDEPSGIGMSKDAPDFVRFVNGVLERMRADGTWKRSYERWLSPLGPTPAAPAAVYRD